MAERFTSLVELFQLQTRILCDTPPINPSAICFFSETVENEPVIIESAANMYHSNTAPRIAVSGYEGCDKGELQCSGWKVLSEKLISAGVRHEDIDVFPLSTDLPPCTDSEARGLVRYAAEKGWENIILSVPPLHQFRAMMSIVSPILKRGSNLNVWSVPAEARDYSEAIVFSQSVPKDTRVNLLAGELEKVIRYFEKGDHVSAKDALGYFMRRDAYELSNRGSRLYLGASDPMAAI